MPLAILVVAWTFTGSIVLESGLNVYKTFHRCECEAAQQQKTTPVACDSVGTITTKARP